MSEHTTEMIFLTDGRAQRNPEVEDFNEPEHDSIVLTRGLHGQAWQRFISDGLWHAAGSGQRVTTWSLLLRERDLVLVYDAEPREAQHLINRGIDRPTSNNTGCPAWCDTFGRHTHPEVQQVGD